MKPRSRYFGIVGAALLALVVLASVMGWGLSISPPNLPDDFYTRLQSVYQTEGEMVSAWHFLRVAAALALYECEKGTMPGSVEELVPRHLPPGERAKRFEYFRRGSRAEIKYYSSSWFVGPRS